MTFVHDDPEWPELLRIVGEGVGRDVALVEKDYWVTHTLWAMLDQGFGLWFKGGTSLSKAFNLIERLSEDIDVRVATGTSGIAPPSAGPLEADSLDKPPGAAQQGAAEACPRSRTVPRRGVGLAAAELHPRRAG